MAPSWSTATGILPQILDDPRLLRLQEQSQALEIGNVDALMDVIVPWDFEEQVDLHEWIHLLDAIDAVLRMTLKQYPALILVHVEPKQDDDASPLVPPPTLEEVEAIPRDMTERLNRILRFLTSLLTNSCSKAVFNSVPELVDLLAAADDETADLALDALHALTVPPMVHRQQGPEAVHQNHHHHLDVTMAKICQARVLRLTRGWGTRAQGLGLYTVVTEDDSERARECLPTQAGHVHVRYLREKIDDTTEEEMVHITLTEADILAAGTTNRNNSNNTSSSSPEDPASKKRRIGGGAACETKPTAELFLNLLESQRKAGGGPVKSEWRFSLLADTRLARGFYSQASRQTAVTRRLRAITTVLYAQPLPHQQQDVISTYFQAQPELAVEIVDLLRPTVGASSNVSASAQRLDAISGLSNAEPVPFDIRLVALDTLTALVSRRDGASGSVSGAGRLSNLLGELGVGKGQYLGLLPTLIRYSLSPLSSSSFAAAAVTEGNPKETTGEADMEIDPTAMQLGLAFVEATKEHLAPRVVQVERALLLVEQVLTLTSTVVATPSGTSALTDCGLITTLLSVVNANPDTILKNILPEFQSVADATVTRLKSLLRFIAAQAIQVLESAVVNHGNALTSFHELKGVEVLTSRLALEMKATRSDENAMDVDDASGGTGPQICFSQRVLLFSVVTCTAVIFHQQSTASSSTTVPTSSDAIKTDSLTAALIDIMKNAESYGGHLTSLTATLMSDIMNSDPHVVRYVYDSGIAAAFLDLVCGRTSKDPSGKETIEPNLLAVPEMIMAVPNVILALALTSDGAKTILEKNPFPAFLRLFYHPRYAMPESRCLLNEMTAIIGTGLDEIMRHVERLKTVVLKSIAEAINAVVDIADDLKRREIASDLGNPGEDLDRERSCLIQYVLNFGQLLEQLLHNEDNCEPFVEVGGLDALFKLFSASLPAGKCLLSHLGGLSAPAVSTLHHSTIEDSLSVAFKCIEFKYDSALLLRKITTLLSELLDRVDSSRNLLLDCAKGGTCLEAIPEQPLYAVCEAEASKTAEFLACIANVHWLTNLLSSAVKAANQKGQENGGGWNRQDREWKNLLSSPDCQRLCDRLSHCHSSCILDVCKIRTSSGFEDSERERQLRKSPGVCYRIRIVCPEGAVVRDGIDIDSCANVGSMEMGEVVESFDRCINSSGILRYHTSRGWVSEMTRGQSREPIAEVVSIWVDSSKCVVGTPDNVNRREAGVPSLRTSAVGVLAKLQSSFTDFHGTLSRVIVQSLRTLSPASLSFDADSQGACVAVLTRQLSMHIRDSFNLPKVLPFVTNCDAQSHPGASLYFGYMLSHVHNCLFDEKRERRLLNFPLLVHLLNFDALATRSMCTVTEEATATTGFLEATSFVFEHCLSHGYDIKESLDECVSLQRTSRVSAASLPPAISLLRRLVATPISNSPVISVMSRIAWKHVPSLVGLEENRSILQRKDMSQDFFQPEQLWRAMQVLFSDTVKKLWCDKRFCRAPPFIIHPVTSLVAESIAALEEAANSIFSSSQNDIGGRTRLRELLRQRSRAAAVETREEVFEATEDTIQGLADMGFSRDHAIDAIENTQSNRVEVAMEYALSHPPPSPSTISRRRQAREERTRARQDAATRNEADNNVAEEPNEAEAGMSSPAEELEDDKVDEDKESSDGVETVKKSVASWLDSAADVCVDILTFSDLSSLQPAEDRDAENEAKAAVLSSFLLDLSRRYPDRREAISLCLLRKLRALISSTEDSSVVAKADEHGFASLCHSLALFVRAIPRTRLLVLEKDILRPMIGCLLGVLNNDRNQETSYPTWMAPSLLLLDAMAQPLVAFSRTDLASSSDENDPSGSSELQDVKKEHAAQVDSLSDLARSLFSHESEQPKADEAENKKAGFDGMLAYHPLLPPDCEKSCLEICRKLLVSRSDPGPATPPGMMHASLSLLLRLLRSPETSSLCLKVASSILNLPKESRFTGNTGLVAIVFRRLLEDKRTLQAAMETEIQNSFGKLSSGSEAKNKVTLSAFVEAVTPLMYREPHTFLHAMALSLRIEKVKGSEPVVVLITPAERERVLSKLSSPPPSATESPEKFKSSNGEGRRRRSSSGTKEKQSSKSKLQRRRSSSRKKKDQNDAKHSSGGDLSPAHVIASLLIRRVVEEHDGDVHEDVTFLRSNDLLDMLADLVLAVPACASAVHNYRPHKAKLKVLQAQWVEHALPDSPAPSKTFVSYLLHRLLTQNRWGLQHDRPLWERPKKEQTGANDAVAARREAALHLCKLSQASARLLVALVARPGEGRKRTIAEISFALSGGQFGHNDYKKEAPSTLSPDSNSLHALSAWGELCLGFAAPRSNGRTVETNSSLSLDIIKTMLEHGVAHALLRAIHRVPLCHPMAPSTCSALLLPFELLTRPALSDAIASSMEREKADTRAATNPGGEAGTNSNAQPPHVAPDFGLVASNDNDDGDTDEDELMDDVDVEDDISNGSTPASDESDETTDSEMEDDEDEGFSSEIDEDEEVSSTEVGDEGEWNVDYRNSVVHHNESLDFGETPDEDRTDRGDQGIDEGWTRIESSGFGGMLLGRMVRGLGAGSQSRRGLMDAAETMIGSLLRTGEISPDTLAEIEGSLGININGGNGSLRLPAANLTGHRDPGGARSRGLDQSSTSNVVLGTLPQIHQRNSPDFGYSSFGSQAIAGNSMEIVYGGPSVASGTRYYDPLQSQERDESQTRALGELDLQLFPGGPYAAASPQAHQSLHPLLCGVNLPPVNSLISDLLSHGTRSTRQGHLTTRRPGDWTESNFTPGGLLVSTSTGDLVQTNRSHSGAPLGPASRSASGPTGWTDDGMPVDATVERFSSAFQNALSSESCTPPPQDMPDEERTGTVGETASPRTATESDTQTTNAASVPQNDSVAETVSEGEAVASSLANGLRLSSEGTANDTVMEEADEISPNGFESNSVENGNAADVQSNEGSDSVDNVETQNAETSDEPIAEDDEAGASTEMAEIEPVEEGVLTCPPGVDREVFSSLPREMQQDCVDQYNSTRELTEQVDGTALDPEALAALPEDLRQEVIEQERRRQQQDAPADPTQAEDMDNASFLVSLTPELREEILLTADDTLLASLPPGVVAEAHILRERASSARQRGMFEDPVRRDGATTATQDPTSRRRQRNGKVRVEREREIIAHLPKSASQLVAAGDLKAIFRLFYLSRTLRPTKLLQKILFNISANKELRTVVLGVMVSLLEGDSDAANAVSDSFKRFYESSDQWGRAADTCFVGDFPPLYLIEANAASLENPGLPNALQGIAERSPDQGTIDGDKFMTEIAPIVSARLLETIYQLFKNSPRMSLHCLSSTLLTTGPTNDTCFDKLLDLLERPGYYNSSTNLEQLLTLLEAAVSPLSHLSKSGDEDVDVSQQEEDAARTSGKEWVQVPHVKVSQHRLQLLCSILRMETCRDASFTKVNTIVRRLCRIESNRGFVLSELATVARALGDDATLDLKALHIRMDEAVDQHHRNLGQGNDEGALSAVSGSVTLCTSASELKLLRVLQTLHALCVEARDETGSKRHDGNILVSEELVNLLGQMHLDELWKELTACLNVVQVLEGVQVEEPTTPEETQDDNDDQADTADDASGEGNTKKILRNNAAGLLTRFLPAIETFFVANASATRPASGTEGRGSTLDDVVNGPTLLKFVSNNKVLLNALVRNNASLLDKSFRSLVQISRCRVFLDFDVKRQWFKTQVRRLRQQASRRHGSLRLHIQRTKVFEEAYYQLRHRNADEMRGRLHITFRDEAGVDAGGLSREFFGILAKEMFNPNYALFTSTEDGCTFQPNPNSNINHDHLSYFRFVGRIVGKAVSDGYLLDAHFTRSLYKHMLGLQPTHQDMEAIDQDYYRNLKTILDYDLDDIGLDLTFSVEDHSFGRNQIVDLIPNGRSVPVTEENKEDYVQKICQHRMTTAIQNQIKAYLDGFYELVSPDLIAIFTPGELELLISGLPEIDITDLKKNTDYVGWKSTDKQIEWFWNVMFSLSRNEKASFLQFVTGSSKVPLAGFSDLQGMRGVQKFSLHKVGKKGSLMSAHTCFNSVDFPVYETEEELRKKLLFAINEGSNAFLVA